jgi:hypothetical protein
MSVDVNAPVGGWVITDVTRTLCSGDLSTSNWCFMPDRALPPGNYNLIAIYNGTEDYGRSASGLEPLTVLASEPSAISLGLSSSTATVGHEQSDVISFQATDAETGRPAEGVVTVQANGKTLSQCDGATSAPQALTVVAPQPTTTRLTLSASSVPLGQEQAELFTVQVAPGTSGTPTGNVTVKAGATAVCTIILANGTGNCTLTSRQLARLEDRLQHQLQRSLDRPVRDGRHAPAFAASQTLPR